MPPKIEQKPEVPNIIKQDAEPQPRQGQAPEGPKRNDRGNYMPAEYTTQRGNTRTDR